MTTLSAALSVLLGCQMKDAVNTELPLPRFSKLEAFDPHRSTFECKHEALASPPITPEAEALFQMAQAATSFELWPEQRDHAKAASLYKQAMELGHWKAQFNLAGLYLRGKGVPQDTERALQLTEDLMRKGVPAAWDNMGAYYMGGIGGLKQDATVAYAFWQKAADMGSMAAQAYIGQKLTGTHDDPPSFWGNRPIGLKMLECAFAQGSSKAAYELGMTLKGTRAELNEDNDRALKLLHEGVKLGSEDSAGSLSASFRQGKEFVGARPDVSRADRYHTLANALYRNPDLRFPNLDKVLPLPPARLPHWDGKDETLIDAAKAVVPTPVAPKNPASHAASQRTGRAHIPDGFLLPERPQVEVPPEHETTSAPKSGYWIARLMRPVHDRHTAWNESQLPLRYDKGELFDRSRTGLQPEDGRIQFHYLGELVAVQPANKGDDPIVARGIARYGDKPEPFVHCRGDAACPQTGVWSASVAIDHPLASVFNQWDRQAYVIEGQPFPDPRARGLDIEAQAVTWQWWDQRNEVRGGGWVGIRVDELMTSCKADDLHAGSPAG